MWSRIIVASTILLSMNACGGSRSLPATEDRSPHIAKQVAALAAPIQQLHKQAEKGDAEAQFNLGLLYDRGREVPKDKSEALRWYRLAADKGFAPAQHSLGKLLAGGGQGVASDKSQGYMWLVLSAGQGDEEAARQSEILSKQLTPAEVTNAKKLAKQWKPSRASVTVNKVP